ncbi:hypothetical protein Desor_5379 [Desulfosporosinus orientis DSM 765]|uniref:Uncharacterized protein n=1 Tax=Desulfosporosinus orientis (strain ATCC 19365 / DSM 765 / NCIMB 8382 / VKM B-1628 / Singapore I) TaxID=768706 RepID=G7WEE2_DESOD|nr:hypothetical protein [Desulfosporosinus orientis]AET70755.1 hypothetical protein Desor_5379 [Desulfosporosinus orientis DSM 765]
MKFGKIVNFTNMFGQSDYKNIDINLIVAGSQAYKSDGSCFVFAYDGDIPQHEDISELTQVQWQEEKMAIDAENSADKQTIEQKIDDLQSQNAQAILALVIGGLM